MEKKVIDKHMDKHLENVQYEARAALDRFGEYGMKIDKKFLNHFLKATIERLNQTCKRYGTESKWQISDKMPNAKATTSTVKATEATKRTTSKATATTTATATATATTTTIATATTTTTMAATTTSTNPPVRAPITTTASVTSAKVKLMETIDLTSGIATKRLSKDATVTEHLMKKRNSNKTDGKNDVKVIVVHNDVHNKHGCEGSDAKASTATKPKTPTKSLAKAATTTTMASGTSETVNLIETIDLTSGVATKRLSKEATGTEGSTKKRKSKEIDGKIDAKVVVQNDVNYKHVCDGSVFFCFYCLEQSDFSGTESFSGTIDEVYSHWLAKHANESISKPFKFCAVTPVRCFHCNDVGMFHNLVKHHEEKHAGKQFAIVDRIDSKKCGICHFKDDDLVTHFKLIHGPKSTAKGFNPIYYSEKRIAELLTINVHKRRQCGKCAEIFETHDGIAQHFRSSHNDQAVQSTEFVDNRRTPDHLICGFCRNVVDCTRLVNHFREHTYNFTCSNCPYRTGDFAELICHEKSIHNVDKMNYHCEQVPVFLKDRYFNTDMVFPNGLTMKLVNVLETKFDESKLFNVFVEGFLQLKKEHAMKMIQLMGTNVNVTDAQNHLARQTQAVPVIFNVPVELVQIQSPLQTSFTTSSGQHSANNDPTISLELIKQQKHAKSVFVHGVSSNLNIGDPYEFLLKFCWMLGVSMDADSIERIFQCERGLIVNFHQMIAKQIFLSQISGQFIWIHYLIALHNGETSRKVYITNSMTPFYLEINSAAEELMLQGRLHSYEMTENGLAIKLTPTGAEYIVQSKQQLMELLASN